MNTPNTYKDFSEKKLVRLSKKEDGLAFTELVGRNKEKIMGWIYSSCKNGHDVEDFYQMSLLKAWKNMKKFRGDCQFLTWMNRISRNIFYDDYRKKQRKKEESLEQRIEDGHKIKMPVTKSEGAREIYLKEIKKIINRRLKKLSKDHRTALVLSVCEGLEYSEIAKITKTPIGTVMSRIFYARREAKKHLAGVEFWG